MSKKYTAYHLFQRKSGGFSAVNKAGSQPYTSAAYRCKHSQTTSTFQFRKYQQRTHFDAANTSCCGERVRNYNARPQYSKMNRPPAASDCEAKFGGDRCSHAYFRPIRALQCGTAGKIMVTVHCPEKCNGPGGEIETKREIEVDAGTWVFRNRPNPDSIRMDLMIKQSILDDAYHGCTDTTGVEAVCGSASLSYTVIGWYGGSTCPCVCCDDTPVPIVTSPSVSTTWGNVQSLSGNVYVNEACSGGSLSGVYNPTVGAAQAVTWTGADNYYYYQNSSRYVYREPNDVGDASRPACCGGNITWTGNDGCGGSDNDVKSWSSRITKTEMDPDGQTYYLGGSLIQEGRESCSWSSSADLSFSYSCMTATDGSLSKYSGYLRRISSSWSFSTSGTCDHCCGEGEITANFADGCGGSDSTTHYVRRYESSGSLQIGWELRCQWTGSAYKTYRRARYCGGTTAPSWSTLGGVNHSTLTACNTAIGSSSASDVTGLCASPAGLSACTSCCRYANNGQALSSTNFRGQIICVSDTETCCVDSAWLGYNSSSGWVYGSASACCPSE